MALLRSSLGVAAAAAAAAIIVAAAVAIRSPFANPLGVVDLVLAVLGVVAVAVAVAVAVVVETRPPNPQLTAAFLHLRG